MKSYKFFIYWVLTILMGSIVFSIFDLLLFKGFNRSVLESLEILFGSSLMAIFYSGLFSLAPLIPFFLFNIYLKKNKLSTQKILIIKSILIFITFCVMFIVDNARDWYFYFIGMFSYGSVGLLFWWREFKTTSSKLA